MDSESKIIIKKKKDNIDPLSTPKQLEISKMFVSGPKLDALKKKNQYEQEDFEKSTNKQLNLYPHFNDPNFNIKIANKKEFNNTQYNVKHVDNKEDFEKYADILSNKQFELKQHQQFIRNFLSFETPYNSMLLYHGLGTGKTCTSIGVAEEMRMYLKQMNISQRIIVVASPNVQENFKLQLFDHRKLEQNNGLWNLEGCTGHHILNEINPTNLKNIPKEKIITLIKTIINQSYLFLGYRQFANYIYRIENNVDEKSKNKNKIIKKNIENEFNNRLIIIDEIHNIRSSNETDNKIVSNSLLKLVKYTTNMHLLLLSATPMYNNYKEIIWLLNLLNINDNRGEIKISDIFDSNGEFIKNEEGENIGKKILIDKSRGYVSFVRGENPYTFPYRIFPFYFNEEKSFIKNKKLLPTIQINGKSIENPIKHIDLYKITVDGYQENVYNNVINKLKKTNILLDDAESFGYTILQAPIESLNMVYPIDNLNENNVDKIIGKNGIEYCMEYEEKNYSKDNSEMYKSNFKYKDEIIEKYGRIFNPDNIGKYSVKIKNICESIKSSKGITLVYSQYINGGLLPLALALEEMGISRYGSVKSLFNDDIEDIDVKYGKTKKQWKQDSIKEHFSAAKYTMITGDKYFSPNNIEDIKDVTDENNINGEKIKVILISKAGSEGIDLKYIRNVHVMEPWYNINRIEQIIGRAIRDRSHKLLPLKNRNTRIFLYGTLLKKSPTVESVDMYIYRKAEYKAIQIGNITRALKESSVDCLLNIKQTNFSIPPFTNIEILQELCDGKKIKYNIGDKSYSSQCDYMESCNYKCAVTKKNDISYVDNDINNINTDTYNENFISLTYPIIMEKIKYLFKSHYFLEKNELIDIIYIEHKYSDEEINLALSHMINDGTIIHDNFNREGKLINIGNYYFFSPIELSEISTINDSLMPLEYKESKIKIDNEKLKNNNEDITEYNIIDIINKLRSDYSKAKTIDSLYYIGITLLERLNFDEDIINNILIEHLFDFLKLEEKKLVIKHIFNKKSYDKIENHINEYIKKITIDKEPFLFICLENKGEKYLFVKDGDKWRNGGEGDYKYIENDIKQKFHIENYIELSDNIGLLLNKSNKVTNTNNIVFKIKYMKTKTKSHSKSYVCSDAIKENRNKLLYDFLLKEHTEIDLNELKGKSNEVCMLIELIFRYYNNIKKDGKIWFLNPTYALINKMDKKISL